MHPRAALGEEAAHGRVRRERLEQLDAPVPDPDGRRLHPLVGHGRALLELRAEQSLVRGQRRVEILNGHAEVMDATRLHAAGC